jgi:hypothetical protein
MATPEAIQIHIAPETGKPNLPKAAFEYVSDRPLPGFVPRSGVHTVYGYDLPRISANTAATIFTVTNGTVVEKPAFGPGGIPLEWMTQDTGIDVQWLNHRGACTRGISLKWDVVDEDGLKRVTEGGSASEGDSSAASVATLPTGYALDDLIQPGILVSMSDRVLSSTSHEIRTQVVPLERDFHGDEGGPDHGGTLLDPIAYNALVDTTYTIGWNNNSGIHKITKTLTVPGDAPWDPSIISLVKTHSISAVFGFDECYAYDSTGGGTYTKLTDTVIYSAMAAPPLSSVLSVDDIVRVRFVSVHGRVANTVQRITITNASPSVINGTWDCLFDDLVFCFLYVPGSGSQTFTGSVVNIDAVEYAANDDTYKRSGYLDRTLIEAGEAAKISGDDQEGHYPAKTFFGANRNAFIQRATGVAGYSLDNDFAVALYFGAVGNYATSDDDTLVQWQSYRQASTPSGNATERPTQMVALARSWQDVLTAQMPVGELTTTAYICTGTYSGVQTRIGILNGFSDAFLGL